MHHHRILGLGSPSLRLTFYQARHRVDVYEARTRREVGTLTLDGRTSFDDVDDVDGCARSIVSDDGAEGDAARYLGPRPEAIQDAVAELVA